MEFIKTKAFIRVAFTGILMIASGQLCAQSAAQDVLDDIIISSSNHTGIIKIKFRIAARYISHTPKQLGNKILIKVALLRNSSSEHTGRESLVPQYDINYGLEEVTFESSQRDQFLTLYFNKTVSYEIIQDADYRSLSLIIHGSQ